MNGFLRSRSTSTWTQTSVFTLLFVVLGQLLEASDGHYTPEAIRWLLLASALGFLGLLVPPLPALEGLGLRSPVVILFSGLVLQFSQILTHPPGMYLRPTGGWMPFLGAVGVAAVLSGSLTFAGPGWTRVGTALVTVCFLAAGIWVLRASPRPVIDVFVFQQQASDALLHGRNPYALTFPNIYGHTQFYGAEVTDGKTLFFGFPYPPLSLLLATLGYLAGGDYRVAQLGAFVVAAACIIGLRPDRLGALAAVAFLFTPRGLFVLEQGWTEPFGVALLGLTLLAAVRAPRVLWIALGALFAWKQYTVVLLPLTVLLIPRPFSWSAWGRLIVPTLLATAAITLPLALWEFGAFWRSVVWLQTVQPFRTDALSFPSALAAIGYLPTSVVPTLVLFTALSIAGVLWFLPRSPAGFAAAVTLTLGVFFAFNKQSFCNYWFMVQGASVFAIVAGRYLPASQFPHQTSMLSERLAD